MIQVELHDRANNLVRILAGAKNAAYHSVLNQDGAGSFLIHRADPDVASLAILAGGIDGYIVHLLRKGPLETTFTDRFSFVIETVGFGLDQKEEANAWITVAGRGTLSLLEGRLCWPPGFDGVNASSITNQLGQPYVAKSGGFIMDAELDRSASRFSPAITHSVQSSTIGQTVTLRFDDLRLLHDGLVKSGPMDAQMFGLDYQCVDVRGTDKSAQVTVKLSSLDSMLGLTVARDASKVTNWILAQGTGEGINTKMAVQQDAAAIAALRRREGFVDDRQVNDQGQLALDAAGSLALLKRADQRITCKFIDSMATQLYHDFDLGDFITLAAAPLSLSNKYRVVGFTVADTDAEIEDVSLDLNSMRAEYLIKLLQGTVLPTVKSLSVINRTPQGAAQIDSQAYPDECDPTHPFHFDFYLASNLIAVNYAKLSFFLRAFRSPVAGANSVTSGASSASSSGGGSSHSHTVTIGNHTHSTPAHDHLLGTDIGAGGAGTGIRAWRFTGVTLNIEPIAGGGTMSTDSSAGGSTSGSGGGTTPTSSSDSSHTHGIAHTHTVTPTLTYGIFEGVVATGVTVKVNGVDRTTALGGGAGFTASQTELALLVSWLNLGAWNTIDLTPTGLGRITGHLTVVSYIQSV